jgi:phosphorylcholine metabolism protein LicD
MAPYFRTILFKYSVLGKKGRKNEMVKRENKNEVHTDEKTEKKKILKKWEINRKERKVNMYKEREKLRSRN